ncbi:MAG: hypothetical protein J0I77_02705 [Rudaea sp.]|uniref:hypothetical protein n=1 Tax=Rudaea sp. 3F27F6 TaxID=2502208 RepID=UPI001484DC3E|nr:hypothetical protein [Rudaea sp. 3F27F6]MBN8884609.1 hypothetical protein [Rudaea sp.]
MPYVYKPRGKRNTSSQPHPVALVSAYRYKSMMRALVAQTRAKREIKATDGIEQSSVRASIA